MGRSQSKVRLCSIQRTPYSQHQKQANFRSVQRKKLRSPLRSRKRSTRARRSMRGPPRNPHRSFQRNRSETTSRRRRFLLSVKVLLSPKFLLTVKRQLSKRLQRQCLISSLLFPPSLSFRKQPYLQPCQKLPKHHPLQ